MTVSFDLKNAPEPALRFSANGPTLASLIILGVLLAVVLATAITLFLFRKKISAAWRALQQQRSERKAERETAQATADPPITHLQLGPAPGYPATPQEPLATPPPAPSPTNVEAGRWSDSFTEAHLT